MLPWKPEFWSNLPQNLMQPFPHPSDATHKIWSRLTNWLQRWMSLKVWTTTDDRPLVYYKLALLAFGSVELTRSSKGNDHTWIHCAKVKSHFKNINGPWKPEAQNKLTRAFMLIQVTSNFDDDSIKNEWASMETPFSHYKSMGNILDLKGS